MKDQYHLAQIRAVTILLAEERIKGPRTGKEKFLASFKEL